MKELDAFYGDFQALFGLSLSVAEGETLAVIGANGAGKSTFLNAVAGLFPSPPGSIRLDGRLIGRLPAHERVRMGISLVPEGRRLFPTLTVEENLRIGTWGGRRGSWTVQKVFELFPLLERRRSHLASRLSGGEQQAASIGRALMANPRLLLMDEISLGLAPIVVRQLYEAIPTIAGDGATLILVEQDVTQALKVADRVICFLEGRITLEGPAWQLSRENIRAAYFGI